MQPYKATTKKRFALLLTLCLLLALPACGEEDPYIPDDPDGPVAYTLDSVAGWWTKSADFDGITVLYTFAVDAAAGTATAYDEYGTAYESYECWYDESGFSLDAGEPFGVVTYAFNGSQLLDEEGLGQLVGSQIQQLVDLQTHRGLVVAHELVQRHAEVVGQRGKQGDVGVGGPSLSLAHGSAGDVHGHRQPLLGDVLCLSQAFVE